MGVIAPNGDLYLYESLGPSLSTYKSFEFSSIKRIIGRSREREDLVFTGLAYTASPRTFFAVQI